MPSKCKGCASDVNKVPTSLPARISHPHCMGWNIPHHLTCMFAASGKHDHRVCVAPWSEAQARAELCVCVTLGLVLCASCAVLHALCQSTVRWAVPLSFTAGGASRRGGQKEEEEDHLEYQVPVRWAVQHVPVAQDSARAPGRPARQEAPFCAVHYLDISYDMSLMLRLALDMSLMLRLA